MGLVSAVLISLVFPALMLLITVGLGRMEEFLLPHLRAPLPAEGETDTSSEEARDSPATAADTKDGSVAEDIRSEDIRSEDIRAEGSRAKDSRTAEIRAANARADVAKARAEALRRSARRRAYGIPRSVGRTNTGPPRGARTTPLRFR